MTHKISILWGETPRDGQKAKTYKFKTKTELKAFKLGISEHKGFYEWEEVEEDYVFRWDQPRLHQLAEYYRKKGI